MFNKNVYNVQKRKPMSQIISKQNRGSTSYDLKNTLSKFSIHVNIFFEKVNTTVMYTEIGCPFMKSAPFLQVDPFTSQTSH